MLACLGAGHVFFLCLPSLRNDFSTTLLLLFRYLAGMGALIFILFILALCGLFQALLIYPLVAVSALLGAGILLRNARNLALEAKHEAGALFQDSPLWLLLLLLCFGVWIYFFGGLGTTVDGDSVAFYYALAKLTAATGKLAPLPGYELFSGITLYGDMISALFMLLKMPDFTQKMYGWLHMLPAILLFYSVFKKTCDSRRAGILAAVFLCTSTAYLFLTPFGKNDSLPVSFCVAAVFCLLQAVSVRETKTLFALAGLFAGCAVGIKYSYLIILCPWLLVVSVYVVYKQVSLNSYRIFISNFVKLSCVTGGVFLLFLAPHFLKNILWYGSLVGLSSSHVYFSTITTIRLLLLYPLALVYGNFWVQGGHLTPLLLALLPFVFMLSRKEWALREGAVVYWLGALAGLGAWLVLVTSVFQLRYILAVYLCLGIPLWLSAAAVSKKSKAMSLLIVMLSVLSFYGAWKHSKSDLYHNWENTRHYIESGDPLFIYGGMSSFYLAQSKLNETAPENARVFLMYYRYWLRPDLLEHARKSSEPTYFATKDEFWRFIIDNDFSYIQMDFTTIHLEEYIHEPPEGVRVSPVYVNDECSVKIYKVTVE